MNMLHRFFSRNQISKPDRETIIWAFGLLTEYYRLPDGQKEQIPYEERNDTSMIKFIIRTDTSLTDAQRIDLARLIDSVAWRANTGRIAEDVVMIAEDVIM